MVALIQLSRTNAIRAVNAELINLYWNIGAFISKQLADAAWGEGTVDELAKYIEAHHPEWKGFSRRGLYRMKHFYETYAEASIVTTVLSQLQNTENQDNTIVSSVLSQLEISDIRQTVLVKVGWSHHLVLISRTKTQEERQFYLNLSIKENYSVRELERQISSSVFERVMAGNAKLPKRLKETRPETLNHFKDSYVFEFLNLTEPHDEKDLQKSLIKQLKHFILELGKDYLFIGEEFRLSVGNSDYFIDLLFYHRSLQCLVVFELKADKFRPEHLGQLNFYLEALDRDVKKPHENPSIGVLLCKDKDHEVVEYALSRNLSPTMVAAYEIQLPDKAVLQRKLHELFEGN